MRQYFDAEMRLLQEAAQEFADAYPEQAGMLNLRDLKERDPYVERLLEGTAYLTAHVRKRIDDGVPNISENVLKQICPSLLRPYPSTTIIENKPDTSYLQSEQVKAGSSAKSVRYHNSDDKDLGEYSFRTCYPVTLQPLVVEDVSYVENQSGGMTFSIDLRWNSSGNRESFDLSDLTFYIHADLSLSVSLYHSLVGGTNAINVSFSGSESSPILIGGNALVQPENIGVFDGLLPNSGQSHPGFSLLQDYFSARERFLFFSIHGLEKIDWNKESDKFTLKFESSVLLPQGTKVNASNLRLNCVPAINLFDMDCEPIKQTLGQMEYRLTAAMSKTDYVDIYSVNRVSSYNKAKGCRSRYHPLYEIQDKDSEKKYYSEVSYDTGVDKLATFLQVSPTKDALDDVISCEITATNGFLPRRNMLLGDLSIAEKGFSKNSSVSNITRPTQFFLPPGRDYYQWQLVSLLTLKLSTISDAEKLKELLRLFDWTKKRDNQLRIEGISKVDVTSCNKVMRGVFRQGIEIQIEVSEERYSSLGDIYLFGQVLHSFFSMYAMINEFVQTKIICLPSYEEFLWMPKTGLNSAV